VHLVGFHYNNSPSGRRV